MLVSIMGALVYNQEVGPACGDGTTRATEMGAFCLLKWLLGVHLCHMRRSVPPLWRDHGSLLEVVTGPFTDTKPVSTAVLDFLASRT